MLVPVLHVPSSKTRKKAHTHTHTDTHSHLFRVPVKEEIGHDVPGQVTADGTTKTQHLSTQKPPHQSKGVLALYKKTGREREQSNPVT